MTNLFEEKKSKASIIESMLTQLGMTTQELIDLIKKILSISISDDKENELDVDIEKISKTKLPLLESSDEETPNELSIEELASLIANGNIKYLLKYLTLDLLKKLVVRLRFAMAIKALKDMEAEYHRQTKSQGASQSASQSSSQNNSQSLNANQASQSMTAQDTQNNQNANQAQDVNERLKSIEDISVGGSFVSKGRGFYLSLSQAERFSNYYETMVAQRQVETIQYLDKVLPEMLKIDNNLTPEMHKSLCSELAKIINERQSIGYVNQAISNLAAQLLNDPNSQNNPNAAVNVVKRIIHTVLVQAQAMGVSSGGSLAAATTMASQLQQAQKQQSQQVVQNIQKSTRVVESAFREFKKAETKIKSKSTDIEKVEKEGKELTAKVKEKETSRSKEKEPKNQNKETKDNKESVVPKEKKVNLREHLRNNNKLTPENEKLLKTMEKASDKINKNLTEIQKNLPDSKSFQFDATGSLNVKISEDKHEKTHNLSEFITSLRRELQKIENKAENKKEEIKVKRTEAREIETVQKGLEQTSKQAERSQVDTLRNIQPAEKPSAVTSDKILENPKESIKDNPVERLSETKNKLIDSVRSGREELKGIESSIKEVMKNMEKALENKDLVNDIKKERQGLKTFEKSQ